MLGLTVFVLCGALLNLCQGCTKSISVEVTSNGTIELPYVNQVKLWSKESVTWIVTKNRCHMMPSNKSLIIHPCKSSENIIANINERNYTINLIFSEDKISCENVTLDVEESDSFNFTCIPVSSCNNSDDETIFSINWKIGYSQDGSFTDLNEGPYAPPGSSPSANENVVSFTDETIKNDTLKITNMNYYSAGFYKVINGSNEGDSTVLHTFTIYYGPMRISSEHVRTVVYDSSPAYKYDDMYCVFRSFPPAVISWTFGSNRMISDNGDYDFVNITESSTENDVPFRSDNIDLTWTINGGLIINQVQYEDSGIFHCKANNGYNTDQGNIRLRVRNRLRPLWPALGIIASFIITAVFIFVGYIVDKIRGEKVTLDPDEINGALHPLSVSSEDDVRTSLHYRRNSSSKDIIVNQS